MKYYYNTQFKNIIGCDNFEPILTENDFEVSEAQYNEIQENKKNGYKATIEVVNNQVVVSYTLKEGWVERQKQRELNQLRKKRKPLLEAFDKYKSNVNYGIAVEDEKTRAKIVFWYSDLLNLVESAFEEDNIPSEIKYYL